jgi:dTDP-4-amino-4,6-dideoxygalactose transaminase
VSAATEVTAVAGPRPAAQARRRFVAPAGTPMGVADLLAASRRLMSRTDPGVSLKAALARTAGVRYAHLVSTGRAAMTLILSTLRDQSQTTPRLVAGAAVAARDEVIIPSYTCFSVAASVVKAGLRPRIVDVDPLTMDFDRDRLARSDMRRVLAIVATNLYGTPSDLPALAAFARSAGVYLVDDAAQALGARIGTRPAGTWGHVGLYSFDKGKNVAAIDGGAIVTDSEVLNAALQARVGRLPAPPFSARCAGVVKAIVYAGLLRPQLYWIPNGIPQLGLGATIYTTDFPLQAAARPLTALAATMIGRLDELTQARRRNAQALRRRLEHIPGIALPAERPGVTAACLRWPMLAAAADSKRALIAELNAAGIGATGSYPTSLADVPDLAGILAGIEDEAAGGRDLAARIVTLPTHPYLTSADIETIGRVVERVMAGTRTAVTVSAGR